MPFEFHLPSLEEMRATPDGLAMLRMIDDDDFRSALITGCPGSGKTTVSIYRLVRLLSQGLDVRFVTYQNLLVLAIRNLVQAQQVAPSNVSTFHKWYCPLTHSDFRTDDPPTAQQMIERLDRSGLTSGQTTEILIDEGQDLPLCVYEAIPRYFARCVVGADNAQQVYEHGAEADDIQGALRTSFEPYRRFSLHRNFRNTYETYRFSRQFIPKTNLIAWDEAILARLERSNDRRGPKPSVIAFQDLDRRNEHLRIVLDNADGNVAILTPRGPRPLKAVDPCESVDGIYDLVTEMGFPATKYHHGAPVPADLERYVVTTFKSAKGMEFDTVVIPRINFSNKIEKAWYVACTRARGRLIIYRDLQHPYYDPIRHHCEPDTYDAEILTARPLIFERDSPF
ncbi:hypothetical protein [uncultured Lamprocystis sp.]|jgi:superfamily I DNA/RNA helicase|uniref:hypothetical protein n=1 Tax=uncultured Lamprocystis sp. TaxID=543132 RepID=UPI0025DA3A78|nr:hypothetical protein [uncultured Lamprocystis sp.]